MNDRIRRIPRYALRAILISIAIVYFLVDLLFLSVLRPLRRRLQSWRPLQELRDWIATLNRYAALLLLVVPWSILEPIKPIAFLLFAHHRRFAGMVLIVAGEIVKLTLLDQLFAMVRPKLMTFPWFAAAYDRWEAALAWLHSLPAWRRVRNWYRSVKSSVVRLLRAL